MRERVKGFAAVHQEHVADNDEVLPHVLLGDLVRLLCARVESAGIGDQSVQGALALLEAAASADDQRLQNLVVVSFLENLEPDHAPSQAIKGALGPALRAHLQSSR